MTLHALEVLMIDGADINFALNNLEGKSNPAAAVALLYSFFFLTGCSPGFFFFGYLDGGVRRG